jgi:IS5 family transposase
MRKRFEQQLSIGQSPISETKIKSKSKYSLDELLAALKAIYCTEEYNERIFSLLEKHIVSKKKKTGRSGMDLWCIFVLAQVRLCLNLSYDVLHDLANNHRTLRQIMGIERSFGYEQVKFSYQNIYDNITMLSDELIAEINVIVLDFGHNEVFKKKGSTALRLKTDSFVVESNVHFPTDYNLLWDSARKCLDAVSVFLEKYEELDGWRKIENWRYEIKGLMRELGKASSSGGKNKQARVEQATKKYLKKARALLRKLQQELPCIPMSDMHDTALIITLEYFMMLMEKHIDLVNRRLMLGEKIPHQEKMFSIFETYTEWINKGKSNPNVELGKKLAITTDQFDLIVDYQLMNQEQDRDIVIELADRLLMKYHIASWSFDKGFWRKENKELLALEVPKVIMPKLGKRNKAEEKEEKSRSFKRLKNKHSAIESNINELEHRGLDRCPDRGIHNYKRYISLAVCAYNLKKIGRKILTQLRVDSTEAKDLLARAA